MDRQIARLAERLSAAAARVAPGSVVPGTLGELARVQRLLLVRGDLRGHELRFIAEELRGVLLACGTTLVVPPPLVQLIDICEELFELARREPESDGESEDEGRGLMRD